VQRSQEKEAGDQDRDGDPEVDVRKNARERALLWRDLLSRNFWRHAALSWSEGFLETGAAML